jgi:phage-related protein
MDIPFLTSIASIFYILASPILPLVNYLINLLQGVVGHYNIVAAMLIIPFYYYLIACIINFIYEEVQVRKLNASMSKELENWKTPEPPQ